MAAPVPNDAGASSLAKGSGNTFREERMVNRVRGVIAFALLGCFSTSAIEGIAAEAFYKGKTINFVVGVSPGGGYDAYTRLISRHIGKHIPGNPLTVVTNMPGAGTLVATQHVYNAKPDGLTIVNWNGMFALHQQLGDRRVQFDASKLEAIGSPVQQVQLCLIAKSTGINSLEEWIASRKTVKLGGLAPGTNISDTARLLAMALNVPLHVVDGYKGGAEIRLAIDSAELDGVCGLPWAIAKASWGRQLDNLNIVLQASSASHAELPKVPQAIGYAKTEDARQLIKVGIHDVSKILQIYSLPPKTTRDRVQSLRQAFIDTMKDEEFLTEARKSKIDIDPTSGEEVSEIMASFEKLPPALLPKLRTVLSPK
jgi:tripartite-type tricarboxylate transporter receptor subunit TctC